MPFVRSGAGHTWGMVATMASSSSTVGALEAAELAGVTYRQLDYWTREGLVRPCRPARGSGSSRRYSTGEVELLRVIGVLSSMGVQGAALRRAAERVEELIGAGGGWLVVAPDGGVELVGGAVTLDELYGSGRPTALVLRLEG